MLVECSEDIGSIDLTSSPPGSLEPTGHRRPSSDPRRLSPEQLGNGHADFSGAPHQAGIDVVVDVADLNRLRHSHSLSCTNACLHEIAHQDGTIGIGVAGSPADEPLRRAIELLIGAAFAMTLSLAPWPWEGAAAPARRAIATAWNMVAALWEAPAGEREAAELAALSALAGARAALPREADSSYEASLQRCGESFERAVAETRADDTGGAAVEGEVSRREAGQLRPSRGLRSESRSSSSSLGRLTQSGRYPPARRRRYRWTREVS